MKKLGEKFRTIKTLLPLRSLQRLFWFQPPSQCNPSKVPVQCMHARSLPVSISCKNAMLSPIPKTCGQEKNFNRALHTPPRLGNLSAVVIIPINFDAPRLKNWGNREEKKTEKADEPLIRKIDLFLFARRQQFCFSAHLTVVSSRKNEGVIPQSAQPLPPCPLPC